MISRKSSEQTNRIHALAYVLIILVGIIAAMAFIKEIINWILPSVPFGRHFVSVAVLELLETIQWLNLILTSLNAILLTYLLYTYISIYQSIRSPFTLGLIALATALLAHTLSTNPVVAYFFGFISSGNNPFGLIPAIFTSMAAIVLVHLSRQ